MSADNLDEQPIPEASTCPECGSDPLPDRVAHNLSAIGYTHDDIKNVCENGHTWTNGVPIGEFDRPEMAEDLWCDSCDEQHMLVHRVAPKSKNVVLHLKCPNCRYFTRIKRSKDMRNGQVALVGYPQICGSTEGCDSYGYED